eukprot:1388735-Amorphochlora_amoeboformis.AAC.1
MVGIAGDPEDCWRSSHPVLLGATGYLGVRGSKLPEDSSAFKNFGLLYNALAHKPLCSSQYRSTTPLR